MRAVARSAAADRRQARGAEPASAGAPGDGHRKGERRPPGAIRRRGADLGRGVNATGATQGEEGQETADQQQALDTGLGSSLQPTAGHPGGSFRGQALVGYASEGLTPEP